MIAIRSWSDVKQADSVLQDTVVSCAYEKDNLIHAVETPGTEFSNGGIVRAEGGPE